MTLVACAPALPTYDTVRDETRAAMQEIVDAMPAGTEVEDLSTEKPFGCEGDGVIYTGHWAAYPEPPFDGAAFIDELPEALGDDWMVDENALETVRPDVAFLKDDMMIDVGVFEDDEGVVGINILALSRCGQSPSPAAGG